MATPKDDDRYNLVLELSGTGPDGKAIGGNRQTLPDMHYHQVVAIEDCWVQLLSKLVDLGYGEAVERGADAAGSGAARKEIRGK